MTPVADTCPASQEVFETCYRGRQSALHHAAYLRMMKVWLALDVLERAGVSLADRTLFDYGFGAGTFFRYCPASTALCGVELDPVAVEQTRAMLARRGRTRVELQPIRLADWEAHPLLQRQYDVVLCSHVLEHLPAPGTFLARLARCLAPGGRLVALVPLHERRPNPHHVHAPDAAMIRGWAAAAGLELAYYLEGDPWLYWVQPLFNHDAGWPHAVARCVSLGLGLPATLLGPRAWAVLGRGFAALTRSRPTQAAFVLAAPR